MKKHLAALAAAILALLVALPVQASGFSLYEQSAKASGQAGAWVARADDAAANWYNPAALAHLEGAQVQFGVNYIDVGSEASFVIDDELFPSLRGTRYDSESSKAFPSHLYWTQKIGDRIALGVGVTSPYGLVTEWLQVPIAYSSRKAELKSIVINPNIAWTVGKRGAFALGLDYVYTDISEFSRLVPVSVGPGVTVTGLANLTGTGSDLGWNAAASAKGEHWSFGATYRSALRPTVRGMIDYTGFVGDLAPYFPDSAGSAKLDLPEQAAVGLGFVGEHVEIEFDVSWAGWSAFESLIATFDQTTPYSSGIALDESWDDTYAFRLGFAWKLSDRNQLRFGLVHDQNPIPDDRVRPSIPDADRDGLTLGYGFHGDKWDVDLYGMRLQFDDRDASGSFASLPSSPADGVLDGRYEVATTLLGVTLGRRY